MTPLKLQQSQSTWSCASNYHGFTKKIGDPIHEVQIIKPWIRPQFCQHHEQWVHGAERASRATGRCSFHPSGGTEIKAAGGAEREERALCGVPVCGGSASPLQTEHWEQVGDGNVCELRSWDVVSILVQTKDLVDKDGPFPLPRPRLQEPVYSSYPGLPDTDASPANLTHMYCNGHHGPHWAFSVLACPLEHTEHYRWTYRWKLEVVA